MADYMQIRREWQEALAEAQGAHTDRLFELSEAKADALQARDCAADAGLWDDTAIRMADREVDRAERALRAASDWWQHVSDLGPRGYRESVLRIREARAAEPTL